MSNLQNGSLIKVMLSISRLDKHHTYSIHTFGSHVVLCMCSHGYSLLDRLRQDTPLQIDNSQCMSLVAYHKENRLVTGVHCKLCAL